MREHHERGMAQAVLEHLLALPAPLVNDGRRYRTLDRLLPHKSVLEPHLVQRLGELFALDYELLSSTMSRARTSKAQRREIRSPNGATAGITGPIASRSAWPWSSREGMPLGYELLG